MGIGLVAEGVGAAVSKITGMISASIESAHALRLQSQELGITPSGSKPIPAWPASSASIPSRRRAACRRWSRRLVSCATGSTEAEAKFAKFGLSARQVASMSNAEVYGAIAQRIKNAGSAADKAALAAEMFGEKLGTQDGQYALAG